MSPAVALPIVMSEKPLVKLPLKAVAGICSVPAPLPTPMVVPAVIGRIARLPLEERVPPVEGNDRVSVLIVILPPPVLVITSGELLDTSSIPSL